MTSVTKLLAAFQKDHGEAVGSIGDNRPAVDRLPTGIFAFDLATGGGFPRGKISIVFGPESSGKTNLVLTSLRAHQKLWPDKTCVFVDLENSFDAEWAGRLGVETKKVVILRPDTAEQAVDFVEAMTMAEDVGLIVIDSLAAMIGSNELEKEAGRAQVGGSALMIGKMLKKVAVRLNQQGKEGRAPTILAVNQVRTKIGVMYGDPETMPGGWQPKHAASMIVRLYGKNFVDPKISKVMPVAKETTFIVRKWKCPIMATNGAYIMATLAHDGLQIGDCNDFNTVVGYLKQVDLLKKMPKGGWVLGDMSWPTLEAMKVEVYNDVDLWLGVKTGLVKKLMEQSTLPVQETPTE